MSIFDRIPQGVYKCLLVVAALIWGFSFVVMKDAVAVLAPAWLLGIRFIAAGALLCIVLCRRIARCFSLRALGAGAVLGLFDFTAFLAQTVGLQHTTPGINAFLTATYCVIVPFAWWLVARKRPFAFNVFAAAMAVAGIGLVSGAASGEALSLGLGEGLTLVCAVLFAFHLVLVSRFASRYDALMLTAFQFVAEGGMACLLGLLTEPFPEIGAFTPMVLAQLAFLAVFASVVAFGIQNVALGYVPPAQGALFLSLESVFGVLFSVLLHGEALTVALIAGFALIFAAIVVNEAVGPRLHARRAIVALGRRKWKEDPHD